MEEKYGSVTREIQLLLWKEVMDMKVFLARNPKQLDLCLKLLYSEKVTFSVKIRESAKKKIEYEIGAEATELKAAELEDKYRILIS